MCHNIKLLTQTKNGSLLYCSTCRLYHVIFGNFHFEFTPQELQHFQTFIKEIDAAYWEKRYYNCLIKRKIPIPTLQQNLCLMLNRTEWEEIKRLISCDGQKEGINIIDVGHIDYDFFLS